MLASMSDIEPCEETPLVNWRELSVGGLLPTGTVCAQGWGWEGWGGWSQTPEGSLAQGMGHYYTGAGIFNEKTAIADSINADTLMRWNDYIFQANQEAARRYVQRRRHRHGFVRP